MAEEMVAVADNQFPIPTAAAGKEYDCALCGYRATRKSSLQRHIKSVHEGIKYDCPSTNST